MRKNREFNILFIASVSVLIASLVSLIFGDWLAANFDVIGIRIAVLIVSFAAFWSSALFSLMVYKHNKTVSQVNDDLNRRAELFRELQFASSNYSIIEFNDRMLISKESDRYIQRFNKKDTPSLHLVLENLNYNSPLMFYTIRIPFKVIEGKTAGGIELVSIVFERDNQIFNFIPMPHEIKTRAYILYNEQTKRNNMIINIVANKDSSFFHEEINAFSKIKIMFTVVSILGVSIEGTSELYFTNPTQTEGSGLHTYKINASNFVVSGSPYLEDGLYDS